MAIADPLVGRLLDRRYRIHGRIARGGMSTVYAGVDERLDRSVAVKVMTSALSADPAFSDRFTREARTVAKLTHPNVVAVYDQGEDDGHVFLVMELVRGRTLRELIREYGRVTPAQAVAIMEPVLAALAAAHRAGMVHRDVKPENILIAEDGTIKVADFGLARAVEADVSSTRTGLMMGTVAYCAPEQISHGYADQRSDVYAAGIVLFELLTGAAPYVGDSAMAVAYQHIHSRVPAPSSRVPGIAEPLDDLVIRVTDPDANDRPVDAAAFLDELRGVRTELSLPSVAVPLPLRESSTDRIPRNISDPLPTGNQTTQRLGGALPRHDTIATPRLNGSGRLPSGRLPSGRLPSGRLPSGQLAPPPPAPPPANARAGSAPKPRRRKPFRRTIVALVILALLGAAAGYGGWWFATGRYSKVPTVGGELQSTAVAALSKAGFKHVKPTTSYSEAVAKDLVISTSPGIGSRALRSSTITLTISRGKERFSVPAVAPGGTQAAAQSALKTIPVQVIISRAANDTVPANTVIGTDPPAGTAVKRNQAITIIVSSGPPVLSVPQVQGAAQTDAQNTLTKAGFKYATTTTYSTTIAAGQVISQLPTSGTQVVKFSTINLVISLGPQYVDIPDVSGKSANDATQLLQNAGFQVKVHHVYGGLLDITVGSSVDDGDKNSDGQARIGSLVTIDVA
jgi:serine/threonine-protein kinase